jgi:hypothetical protein
MMQVDPQSLLTLLEQHLSWYPLMELRDIYKLLYQGVMGSEHLLTSAEDYTQYLQAEFDQLQPNASQRLFEPVRTDGALFRLNLRPYKARHTDLENLTPYLLESARIVTGTRSELCVVWAVFIELCIHGRICNFDANVTSRFSQRLEGVDYPPMHHSDVYQRAYQPAYRLIAAKFIPKLGLADVRGKRKNTTKDGFS